jgi:DNA polymerase III epsilon subunit-like protein
MNKTINEKYISVDIEASGPIPGEYSMLSLGASVVGEKSSVFYVELKPVSGKYVPSALEVSGLNLEKLRKEGMEPAAAMAEFEQWIGKVCGKQRPIFVAFNATFDWMFVHYYFIKFLGRDPFGISGVDIKAYFMGKLRVPWGETTKKRIAAKFIPSTKHTHNALDDSVEQAEIFEKLLKFKG